MDRRSLPKPGGVRKCEKRQTGKPSKPIRGEVRSLPHAHFGEINLTLAKDKSYICYLNLLPTEGLSDKKRWKHVLTVRGTSHPSICQKIFKAMSEKNMNQEEALQLRQKLQSKAS